MKRMPTVSPVSFLRKVPVFLFGMTLGVLLAAPDSELRADSIKERDFAKMLLNAIGILAIDTEVNAEHIVELRQRVNDLEIALEENLPPKD